MSTPDFERLSRLYLLDELPGFAAKNTILFAEPIEYFLKGFAFDRSGHEKTAFSVWAFVQPLFVPQQHVSMNIGGRLGSLSGGQEKWWRMEGREAVVMSEVLEVIRAEGIPFVSTIRNPRDFVGHVGQMTSAADEPSIREAVCYALILDGKDHEATRQLTRLASDVAALRERHPNARQLTEIRNRVARIAEALNRDREGTWKLLEGWRSESLVALHLRDGE